MRQDKFVELRIAQLHWNAVLRLAFGHLDPESIEILADSPHIDKRQTCKGFQTNSLAGETCNQLIVDSGKGLIKGHARILPETTLRHDHFHFICDPKDCARYLKNQVTSRTTAMLKLVRRAEKERDAQKKKTKKA